MKKDHQALEAFAHLEPTDIDRTLRFLAAMKVPDTLEVGRVAVELRSDPRGVDAAIVVLSAVTTLLVRILNEADIDEELEALLRG